MAIVDIALNYHDKPISLQEVAVRQNIALNYLEQIFTKLRRNNIVKSIKGPGGGYILSKNVNEITISEIIIAVNNSLKMTRCSGKEGCILKGNKCLTHNIWVGLEKNIMQYLGSISLFDVINQNINNKSDVRL